MSKAHVAAAAALLVSASVSAADAPVAVNVEGLQAKVAKEVLQHAEQGERALARYLERVRPYQRLSYDELSRPAAQPVNARFQPNRVYRRHAKDWAPQRLASAS
ncbi:MAG TPA: hypothetical protein VEC19_01500 [Usitatibacter sp.]|nr:hypothetical protein [Usitatibacter sp.]